MTTRWTQHRAGGFWPLPLVLLVAFVLVISGQRAFGAGTDPTPAPSDPPSAAAPAEPSPTPTAPAAPSPSPTPSEAPSATASAEPSATAGGEPSSAPTGSTEAPTAPASGDASPSAGETPTIAPTPTPTPTPTPAPEILTGRVAVLATISGPASSPVYLEPGAAVTGAQPFETVRLDVLVENQSAVLLDWTPTVEYRVAGEGEFVPVPEKAVPGSPLHTDAEWVKDGTGTKPGPTAAQIAVADAQLTVPDALQAVAGHRASGPNPDSSATVPPGSAGEQEFSLSLSIDAAFGATYELRVTDAGVPVPGLPVGTVVMADKPDLVVSPGQRAGARPKGSAGSARTTGVASYPLHPAGITITSLLPESSSPIQIDPAQTYTVGANGPATIHQPFTSTTSAQCATCHSTHRAPSGTLLQATSQTSQCFLCHGPAGLGGQADVQSQFTAPANDPSTRSYYSHDLTAPGHTMAGDNEFGGVQNRHSQCSDCHNPHNLGSNPDTYNAATSTWAPSGSYGGVTGVAVTNGAAGTAPSYQLLDGVVNPVTAEYQLCFKCHSGFTTLQANDPAKPSRDFTDVAKALNPSNRSFHPVEAAGKNQTAKMADSLSGTSQYKIWNLGSTDTIRCVMCHTSGTTAAATPSTAMLPAHASANRGILVRPYQDRVLSSSGQFYNASGFALCLTCHAETPFANRSNPGASTATNFVFHGLHVAGIAGEGNGGADIDTPGAGRGNALCAECHFRSHGTTDAVPGQTISGDGLVNFAPDVTASKSMKVGPIFTKTATRGTCTLTCHGKDHEEMSYVP